MIVQCLAGDNINLACFCIAGMCIPGVNGSDHIDADRNNHVNGSLFLLLCCLGAFMLFMLDRCHLVAMKSNAYAFLVVVGEPC